MALPIEHNFEQGSNEWLEFRKSKIGASDAPVIMGVSPWKTPLKLWQQKLGILEDEISTYVMEYGKKMEPRAREEVSYIIDAHVAPIVLEHPQYAWMIASMDGYNRQEGIAVEIKVANKKDHGQAETSHIPSKYYPQLQHQLAVSGLERMYYYSWNPEAGGVLLTVERDDTYIDKLISKELEFLSCLESEEPPLDVVDTEDFLRKQTAADELLDIWDQKAVLSVREEELKDFLKATEEEADIGGVRVVRRKVPGRINRERIQKIHGIDINEYRDGPTYTWAVTPTKKRNSNNDT